MLLCDASFTNYIYICISCKDLLDSVLQFSIYIYIYIGIQSQGQQTDLEAAEGTVQFFAKLKSGLCVSNRTE